MKKLLLLFALALPAFSQTPVPNGPVDCLQQFFFSTGNGNQNLDNRSTGCDQWTIVYQASGTLSGYTLAVNVATGETAPASFGAYSGNVVNSSASFGTAASGIETLCDLASCATMGTTVYNPWVQIALTGAAGTGSVRGTLYGYRTGYTAGTGGSGGGGGGGTGCPNPCPVTQSTSPWVDNIAQWASASLGAPSNYGTSPGAVTVPGVNAFITNSVPVTGACPNPCPVTQSTSPWVDNVNQWDGTALGAPTAYGTPPSGNVIGVNANVTSNVQPAGTAAFTSAQQAVTASAVNLGTNTAKSVCVHALIANTMNIYAGATGVTISTGMEIPPGQGYCWSVSNTNLVYVIASTTGASVSVTWTN